MPTSKKLLGGSRTFWAVLGGIALLLIAANAYGLQTFTFFKLRAERHKLPILDLTPQPLSTLAVSSSPTLRLNHHGYSVESPWTDLNLSKTKSIGTWGVFAFDSHSAITFCVTDPSTENLRTVVAKYVGGVDVLKAMVGKDAMADDLAFRSALLHRTADRVRPWMKEREAVIAGMLLMFKATSSVGGNTGVFEVDGNAWRGFQFDDPAKNPNSVTLELYDARENHVEIVLSPSRQRGIRLTQEDVNRVIQSLRVGSNTDRNLAHAVAARDSERTR